eukprot:gene26962-34993_t
MAYGRRGKRVQKAIDCLLFIPEDGTLQMEDADRFSRRTAELEVMELEAKLRAANLGKLAKANREAFEEIEAIEEMKEMKKKEVETLRKKQTKM